MAQKPTLPKEVAQAIEVVRTAGLDPSTPMGFQEMYNRGLGAAGEWIKTHRERYDAALASGFDIAGSINDPVIVKEPEPEPATAETAGEPPAESDPPIDPQPSGRKKGKK